MTKNLQYYIGFNLIPGIGRVRISQLETYFKTLDVAWQADAPALLKSGLDSATVNAVLRWRPRISPAEELEKLQIAGVSALTVHDAAYPARLKEIYDYPPLIYVKGALLPQDDWSLAVVGTRKPTVYGRQVTEEMVTDLCRNKITIASGLARGIDTAAHNAALAAGGRTVAIFACGLDTIYPAENAALVKRIIENGAIISEHPLGCKPRPDYFPRRNRIMSGMSLGTLVTEAGETSGALITAHMALEQNREVFAIPGSILSPESQGTNKLIQEGAKLVRSYVDILEELNLTAVAQQLEMKEVLPPSNDEAALLHQLGTTPVHIDEVCRNSGLPISTVSGTLAMMELKGMVRQVGTMNYVLTRETRESYRVKVD